MPLTSRLQFKSFRAAVAVSLAAALVLSMTVQAGTASATAGDVSTPGGKVDVAYTSYSFGEGNYRLDVQPAKSLAPLSGSTETTVLVDPSIRYQAYEGFGSTLEDTTIYHLTRLSAPNRERALQALFSKENGNNFNLMRTTIGCADFCRTAKTTGFWTYDDNEGVADPTLANFSIQRDIDDGKIGVIRDILRINPETRMFASMWSPPAWMKTNNSITYSSNANCSELPANANTVKHGAATGSDVDYYPVLAQYYVKYIQAYKDQGIPISIVSLQNEPDIARTYPTNCWTPAQEADFAKVLRAAFDDAELETEVWGLDDNQHNAVPISDALLSDAAVYDAVDGLGFHNYDGWPMWTPQIASGLWPGKSTHLTEITQGGNKLIEYFRSGISSYTGWGMMFDFTTVDGVLYNAGPGWWQDQPVNMGDPDADTPSLISPKAGDPSDYQLNDYYFIFGSFSRFLQPGAQRIDSPGRMGNLYNVAFRNPDGTIIVVVINRGNTRYITSVEDTQPAPVRVATPDGEFFDTIPGDTIATYTISPTTGDSLDRGGWSAAASHTNDAYTATQAIDGQSTTRWTSGLNQAAGQSFTLDLGAQLTFDQVSLNQMERSLDFPTQYTASVSNDGVNWSATVATGAGTPSITNIQFAPQTARFVRITLTAAAAKWWSIGEVAVFDSASGLAPAGAVSATSSGSPSWASASDALDGSMQTAWTPGNAQAEGQWFQVDLGSPRSFNAIGLDAGVSAGDYPREYEVKVSSDGSTWSNPVAVGAGQEADTRIWLGEQDARYVRVTLTDGWSGNWWAIREFRIYNDRSDHADRSGWTAAASTTWSGTSASSVFDGDPSTRWASGVAQASGQTFTVDMKKQRWVAGIDLDTAGFAGDFARGTRMALSVDGVNWRTVADTAGLRATQTVLWPASEARYLRITQTGVAAANYWSLAEVNVLIPDATHTTLTPLTRTGWSATTSPAGWGSAAEAIDGKLSTRWTTLAATTGAEHFQVDLGATTTFRGVKLITSGPMEASTEYPSEYEVWVSDGGAWSKVAKGTGHGPVVSVQFPTQNARYVHVKQVGSSSSYWSVGEFVVLN
jgi:O-glycosyl hydrolase